MPEEIRPDFYRIRIPLPDSPLKYLNSYVIRSATRHLVIDTGLNREECRSAMMAGLEALDVDPADTDFFITHLHADHFGLVGRLATNTSRIFFNRPEAELIESWSGWEPMVAFAAKNGFPEDELRLAIQSHPGHKFGSEWVSDISVMKDGDRIEAGAYSFQCIFTPGHSMGHMCLYEPDQKILVAGDHILVDITPNIQCWSDSENPLKSYLESLHKVDRLDTVLTLPGHRRLIGNPADRIRELRAHHNRRLNEVMAILEKGPQHAYQVASRMTWDLKAESWEAFPRAQKWFATGEALAHLRYLEDDGSVFREPKNRITCFTLSRNSPEHSGRIA
jgi:glyoxylase-like metal-dependent hydrolase (beta-lactamase superfamily II)